MTEAISDAVVIVRLATDHGRQLYADLAQRFPDENSLKLYHHALDHMASLLPHPDLLPSSEVETASQRVMAYLAMRGIDPDTSDGAREMATLMQSDTGFACLMTDFIIAKRRLGEHP